MSFMDTYNTYRILVSLKRNQTCAEMCVHPKQCESYNGLKQMELMHTDIGVTEIPYSIGVLRKLIRGKIHSNSYVK